MNFIIVMSLNLVGGIVFEKFYQLDALDFEVEYPRKPSGGVF